MSDAEKVHRAAVRQRIHDFAVSLVSGLGDAKNAFDAGRVLQRAQALAEAETTLIETDYAEDAP